MSPDVKTRDDRRGSIVSEHKIFGLLPIESLKMGCLKGACYYTVTYKHMICKARKLVSEHKMFGLLPIKSLKMGCLKGAVNEESIGDMTIREHYFSEDTEKFMSISSVYPVIVRFVNKQRF